MIKKPEPSGIPIKKGSWVYREYISKGGFTKYHSKIPIGNIGKNDIPIL
jgi:hypothetical protein